ncbi:hypothetical protein EDB85DRAFT_1885726 [Lactarius pseudohatsudake]|nr:hypothetical protein EDB85DRAFT_1885726 [Lactarius pseudohatsudake]
MVMPLPQLLLPHLARPPLKKLQVFTDTAVAPYGPYLSLGKSRQCVCLGRRFNSTAIHPHRKKPTDKPTRVCAISDHEWVLRTGRIVDTLLATLPNFFINGLTSQIIDPPSLLPLASLTGMNVNADRIDCTNQDQEIPIYSPSICLEYAHPTALLAPLPQNFHVKGLSTLSTPRRLAKCGAGLPLYLASAMFVQHTLNAIYTDLGIELCMVRRQSPPHMPLQSHPRELRVSIGLVVSGQARLTGQPAEWRVHSTYSFEPIQALISHHRIDSILPEPQHGISLDLLRRALDATTSTGMVGQCTPLPIQHAEDN